MTPTVAAISEIRTATENSEVRLSIMCVLLSTNRRMPLRVAWPVCGST